MIYSLDRDLSDLSVRRVIGCHGRTIAPSPPRDTCAFFLMQNALEPRQGGQRQGAGLSCSVFLVQRSTAAAVAAAAAAVRPISLFGLSCLLVAACCLSLAAAAAYRLLLPPISCCCCVFGRV